MDPRVYAELPLSDHHRELLTRSDRAGCFYCHQMFDPREISEWIDAQSVETLRKPTALCPRCGIDAVLPSAMPMPLTAEFLAAMHGAGFSCDPPSSLRPL